MIGTVAGGIAIPFLGTALGAACVFFMRRELNRTVQRALTGFAAGVMVAASVWSLLIPSLEQSEDLGKWSFLPAAVGFAVGIYKGAIFDTNRKSLLRHISAEKGLK